MVSQSAEGELFGVSEKVIFGGSIILMSTHTFVTIYYLISLRLYNPGRSIFYVLSMIESRVTKCGVSIG